MRFPFAHLFSNLLWLLLASTSLNAAEPTDGSIDSSSQRPRTTYERFLPLAVAGDPAIQNFLGYMFFHGEGVDLNYEEAHYWFHAAAEEGDALAQRNLGIFHSRAIDRIPEKYYDAAEANLWFSLAAANPGNTEYSPSAARAYQQFLPAGSDDTVELSVDRHSGKIIYQSFCAGCHGFGGHAGYPSSPSFALGDSLGQDDATLIASILDGKGDMPAWGGTLSTADARRVIDYIRSQVGVWSARGAARPISTLEAGDSDLLALGEQAYLQFCGGCHGFNGIAWYVNSPSFALRERLDKSDAELINSIKNGIGAMPAWEYMLQPRQIDGLIKFIRNLAPSYESGIAQELRRPDLFLRFQPKGETETNWTGDDLR